MNRSHKAHSSTADLPLAALAPRLRIMVAARNLFYAQGLNAVGVELIAAEALTNKMTLYRHFKSKDDLIVAYVTEIANEGDAVWQGLEANYGREPAKMVEAWVDYVEEVLTQKFERGCALANAAVELPPHHAARDVIESYKSRKRERLVQMFARAHYREPDRLADEIFLLFEGARISLQCGGKIPAARIAKLLRQLVTRAPKRTKAKARP